MKVSVASFSPGSAIFGAILASTIASGSRLA